MKTLLLIISAFIMTHSLPSQTYRSAEDAKGLAVGTSAPLFTALTADSTEFSLKEALKQQPVVLIFYRGFWCPVCNKHLSSIQDSLGLIEEAGAKVIAVSPENPQYLGKMAEKTGAGFTLVYDKDYLIADAYDVTFRPSSKDLFVYNTILNGKLKKTHSDDSQQLPIPATYIIDKNGTIVWRQFDPNYKNRSSVAAILEALSTKTNN